MSKEKKGNRETKKPKAVSNGGKKHKKDLKGNDGNISGLLGNSN
jgi:hypothetical protein